ncbi:MAG: nucleotidyltransferase family protein [Geitlerinemataceae cyanobacterium]
MNSVQKIDSKLGIEWSLLELLTLGFNCDDRRESFAELLSASPLNWQEILHQAKRHKLLPLLASYTTSGEFADRVPRAVKQQLRTVLFQNRFKTAFYRQEAARIISAFNQHGIRFVVTKGMSWESTLYDGNGSRAFSDIDWMILPQFREAASQALADLGYQKGSFDAKTDRVVPHSRETLIKYRLNPDHLPSHVRLTDDAIIRSIEVDVANSLTWTHSPFQVPIEVALAEIVEQPIPGIPEVQLPCFIPKFQFLFTILHLFKEAWIEITIDMGKDVTLSKFADVIRLWNAYREVLQTDDFVSTLEEFKIVDPVLWVLEHLDRTFKTEIVPSLGLEGRVTEEWLSSAGSKDGKVRSWRGTMRDRLYCKDRRQLFG